MVSTAARSSRTSSRSSRTEVSVDASCAQAGESRDITTSPQAREYGLLILDPHFLILSIQATGELATAATRYDARRAGISSRSTAVSWEARCRPVVQLTASRTGGRFPEFVVKGKTT